MTHPICIYYMCEKQIVNLHWYVYKMINEYEVANRQDSVCVRKISYSINLV